MASTQDNSFLKPAGTTSSGLGDQPYPSAVEADLSHYSTSGQCEDAHGVYKSPRDRRIAELKRRGVL